MEDLVAGFGGFGVEELRLMGLRMQGRRVALLGFTRVSRSPRSFGLTGRSWSFKSALPLDFLRSWHIIKLIFGQSQRKSLGDLVIGLPF